MRIKGIITGWKHCTGLRGFIGAGDKIYKLSKHSFDHPLDAVALHNICDGMPVEFEPAPLLPSHTYPRALHVAIQWKDFRENLARRRSPAYRKEKELSKPISLRGETKVYGTPNVVPKRSPR